MIPFPNLSTPEAVDNFERLLPFHVGKPNTVLHIIAGNRFGGIERMSLAIARNKSSTGKIVHYFGYSFKGLFSKKLSEMHVEHHYLGQASFLNPFSIYFSRKKLSKLLKKVNPGVVVCHGEWTYSLFAKVVKQNDTKLVKMLHSIPTGKLTKMKGMPVKTKPDLVLANSNITAAKCLQDYPGTNVTIAFPPCILGDRSTKEALRQKTRLAAGIHESCKLIFSAGRFEKTKGFDVLINALARLPVSDKWECWIAGYPRVLDEKKELAGLKKIAERVGVAHKVKWLGHIDEMDSLYAAADVYCQPNSYPESFGMTFVESQNMGCPVITTGIGGALEVVEEKAGNILLPRACPDLVSKAIVQILGLNSKR